MYQQRALSLDAEPHDRFAALEAASLPASEARSIVALALAILAERHRPGQALTSPDDTRAYLRLRLGGRRTEVFGCLFLDNRHRIRSDEELFQGTIDGAAVHPRVVVQRALEVGAAAVLFYHNHPSGVAEPSQSDELITRRLKDALALVEIRVLDHIIVSAGESVSFAERALL